MPSYHLSAQVIRRAAGRSSVAAAAYRAGQRLEDERAGVTHDYSRRGGVAHEEIMAPDDAPDWMQDRGALWNQVEAIERRKDAQLARELNIALPHELDDEERLQLVQGFVSEHCVKHGMVADVAIHRPQPEKGDDPRNHHAHVMLSLRQVNRHGFRMTKTREWNSKEMISAWRTGWAEMQNAALARKGVHERVDHRSLAAQRTEALIQGDQARADELDRMPEIHVGPKSRPMSDRGYEPTSRSREVRTYAGRRRQRDYHRHDQGSRAARNEWVVDQNRKRARSHIEKAEHRKRWLDDERRSYAREVATHDRGFASIFQEVFADGEKARRQFGAVARSTGFAAAIQKLLRTPEQIARMKGLPKSKKRRQARQKTALFGFHRRGRQQARRRQSAVTMVADDIVMGVAQALGAEQRRVARLREFRQRYRPQGVTQGLVPSRKGAKRPKGKARSRRRASGPTGPSNGSPRNTGPSSRG